VANVDSSTRIATFPPRTHDSKTAQMKINASLPDKGRDLRLDLFRGVAN